MNEFCTTKHNISTRGRGHCFVYSYNGDHHLSCLLCSIQALGIDTGTTQTCTASGRSGSRLIVYRNRTVLVSVLAISAEYFTHRSAAVAGRHTGAQMKSIFDWRRESHRARPTSARWCPGRRSRGRPTSFRHRRRHHWYHYWEKVASLFIVEASRFTAKLSYHSPTYAVQVAVLRGSTNIVLTLLGHWTLY